MATALDHLPAETRLAVLRGDDKLRADLLVIPEAEAAGWKAEFRNDSWHNSASFTRGNVGVWSTGRDWRRATLEDGRYSKPEVFPMALCHVRRALSLDPRSSCAA